MFAWPLAVADGDKCRMDCRFADDYKNCIAIYRCCNNQDCCSDAVVGCTLVSDRTGTLDSWVSSDDDNHMPGCILVVSV